jgi:hypothetical protein
MSNGKSKSASILRVSWYCNLPEQPWRLLPSLLISGWVLRRCEVPGESFRCSCRRWHRSVVILHHHGYFGPLRFKDSWSGRQKVDPTGLSPMQCQFRRPCRWRRRGPSIVIRRSVDRNTTGLFMICAALLRFAVTGQTTVLSLKRLAWHL